MASQQENIGKLVGLGFHVCPWEVTHHEFKGSTQLEKEKSPFWAYVGNNYVHGNYDFFQPDCDLRLIEDDLIILMLEQGLPIPYLDRDSGHVGGEPIEWGVLYTVGFRGSDSGIVYRQLIEAREAINDLHTRTPPSIDEMRILNER